MTKLPRFQVRKGERNNMADNFDERSGLIFSEAPWGKWGQTIEDVQILIKVDKGTVSKAIKCNIYPRKIRVVIKENTILEVIAPRLCLKFLITFSSFLFFKFLYMTYNFFKFIVEN